METEILSTDVQVRKSGERRYGKGKIKITDKSVYLSFKKFLGKPQEFVIARKDIAKVEFRSRGLPVEIVGPGYPIGSNQSWVTLEIILKDGSGFTIYVSEARFIKARIEKFRKIYDALKS